MSLTVEQAARQLLLALPQTQETRSHGNPTFRAAKKTYAFWTVNHHGDGRVALWLSSPPGVQDEFVALDPDHYFIPPYVGVKGWIGVDLGGSLPWAEVTARVVEAWTHCVPAKVAEQRPDTIQAPAPTVPLRPEDINPMLAERPQEILTGLARLCEDLPETTPEDAAASAVWKAGKKVFVRGRVDEGRMKLMFRVGLEMQPLYTEDPRYQLPAYYHSSGWIQLDVHDFVNWDEIASLLEASYRHFALKRMIKALDASR